MRAHRRGENVFTQVPSLWHGNTALSTTSIQAPLFCLQFPSTPCFYNVHVQAVSLPGSTSLLNFISNGAVFPNPSLLKALWRGPAPTLWGRVLLSNGQVPACPWGTFVRSHHYKAQRLWLGASLPQKNFVWLCSSRGSGTMVNHNQCQVSPYPGVFIPVPANVLFSTRTFA